MMTKSTGRSACDPSRTLHKRRLLRDTASTAHLPAYTASARLQDNLAASNERVSVAPASPPRPAAGSTPRPVETSFVHNCDAPALRIARTPTAPSKPTTQSSRRPRLLLPRAPAPTSAAAPAAPNP